MRKVLIPLLTVLITVFFINLSRSLLFGSDAVRDFIPFIDWRISTYELLLLSCVLCFRWLYNQSGINLYTLRSLPHAFYPMEMTTVIILAIAGLFMQLNIWPLIVRYIPLCMIRQSEPVRKTVVMVLPLLWLWIVSLLNNSYIP